MEEKKKKIPNTQVLRARLKKALEENGSYNKSLETIIETTAGNLFAYFLALRDLESLNSSYVEEKTREDNIKLVPHPAIKTVREQSEMVRKQLKELRLTLSSIDVGGEDDPFTTLIDTVESVK